MRVHDSRRLMCELFIRSFYIYKTMNHATINIWIGPAKFDSERMPVGVLDESGIIRGSGSLV